MARVANIGDYIDLAELQTTLASQNIHGIAEKSRAAADYEQHPPHETIVSIRTNTYKQAGEAANRKALNISFPRLQIPTGSLTLDGDDPLAATVLNCDQTVVPVVIDKGPLRWSGRVDVAHDNFGGDDADFIECELLHDKAWLTRIVAWPWWFEPIMVQGPPSRGVAFGGAISVIKYIIASQCLRLQLGLWDLVNNLGSLNLDYRSWFGTLLMQDPGADGLDFRDILQAVTTPVYVVPINPFFDTSPFIELDWRMDDIWTLVNKTCEDNGLSIEVSLWEPGMPQPDPLADLVTLLRVPTIVVDVLDRSGISGVTGTFLDGIERDLVDLGGSTFGEVLAPFLNPGNEFAPDGVNIAPALGIHYTKPWVVFTDHRDSGVKGRVSHHHPIAWRTITGGKSPKWMNDLIDATLTYLIDMIMIVVGFTGVPGSILDGAFHDILLAFQLIDNYNRRVKLGPYGFPEKFFPTGSGSYTLDAFFQQKAAQYDTRGWVSGQITVRDAEPYELGRDTFPGAMALYVRRGKLFADFIENATLDEKRGEDTVLEIQIGDGKAEEAPISKIQRRMIGLQNGVNIFLMGSQ